MIQISPDAEKKILEILKDEDPKSRLRMFVEGGGCSGFQYGFLVESESNSDDWEIELNNTKILVDPVSMQYLENVILDFKSDINGERFVINNPNAVTTCGCGSSFSPY
ncbi:MAG: iron-sulfur cluster insertion protein ErpA [Alphaproteobacteria bacterium]|nr:iron-sulfur cluster insertion protein ErpA [Alphaproteobacteria bacterium]